MEFRRLGSSGLKVPVLCFGTATFGGTTDFFKTWGSTQVHEARRLIDVCLDTGVNFFDTADGYSNGDSESILGQALDGRRNQVLISTKCGFPTGASANDQGSSRHHIVRSCEASLKRLKADHIDLYHMHTFDSLTPVEETLRALDDLVSAGKVRYIACSNFSGWQMMKSLAAAEKYGWSRYVANQIYYSLIGRDSEWELIPLAHDQGVGTIVWSPLAGGALTGKLRRDKPAPPTTRIGSTEFIPLNKELLFQVVDVLDEISAARGKTPAQVALNWVLHRPTVSSVVIGARDETQLKQNLGALGWTLSAAEVAKLDAASRVPATYPHWHQREFSPQLHPALFPTA